MIYKPRHFCAGAIALVLIAGCYSPASGQAFYGFAQTPPMGWNGWNSHGSTGVDHGYTPFNQTRFNYNSDGIMTPSLNRFPSTPDVQMSVAAWGLMHAER